MMSDERKRWHVIARLNGLRQIPLGAISGVWPDELHVVVTESQYRATKCQEELYRLALLLPGENMAKQTQKKSVQWRGFKDVKLTDAQRDAYEHWDAEDGDVYLLLASAVASGFKFTMSYNGSNDTYTATLTGQDAAPPAAQGYSLSAFAPDFYNACRTLAYKHDLILEGDWSRIEVSASERWG